MYTKIERGAAAGAGRKKPGRIGRPGLLKLYLKLIFLLPLYANTKPKGSSRPRASSRSVSSAWKKA